MKQEEWDKFFTKKPVYQYTLEKEFITTYGSISEAANKTGFSRSGLSACARKESKTSMGYIWSYKEL